MKSYHTQDIGGGNRDMGESWGDTRSQKVITQYMRLVKLHRSILDSGLKKTGVYRSQHQILMMIARNPNASQRELAELLNVSPATVAVSLKKLEKGGYVDRIVDQEDNRYNQICVTKKGRAAAMYSHQFFCDVERRMFDGFTDEELSQLELLLGRAYRNLAGLLPDGAPPDWEAFGKRKGARSESQKRGLGEKTVRRAAESEGDL